MSSALSEEGRAEVFGAGLLRKLDARGRRDLGAVLSTRALPAGARLFDPSESARELFVVLSGALRVERSGIPNRTYRRGEVLGEEALSTGAGVRLDRAIAIEPSVVAGLPGTLTRRALVRAGGARELATIERHVRRDAVLSCLGERGADSEVCRRVADSARVRDLERGEALEVDVMTSVLVLTGLVAVDRTLGGVTTRERHLGRGDWFLPESAVRGVAIQAGRIAVVDREEAKHVRDGHNAEPPVDAAWHRAATARSLLVVVASRCTDCGACGTACADAHPDGLVRLRRQGDVVGLSRGAPLILATSCQHCVSPACVSACPTGALRADASGRVDLAPDLCTGCGACEAACPWNAVSIVPRVRTPPPRPGVGAPDGAPVALKCDECKMHALGPACVRACPTGALFRVDPTGSATPGSPAAAREVVLGAALAKRSTWPALVGGVLPGVGLGLSGFSAVATGWLLVISVVALVAYRPIARIARGRGVRHVLDSGGARALHIGVGAFAGVLTIVHAVASGRLVRLEGGLPWAIGGAVATGLALQLGQSRLSMRRAAAPRAGTLGPAEVARERSERLDEIVALLSGAPEEVKRGYAEHLARYDRRVLLGPLRWAVSSVSLVEEARGLATDCRVDEGLARLVVERRAFRGARFVTRLLAALVAAHVVAAAVACVVAALHVAVRGHFR